MEALNERYAMPVPIQDDDSSNATMARLLQAMSRAPISTATLACVVFGGAFMYFSVKADGDNVRTALGVAQQRGSEINARQDNELREQKSKIERLEGIVIDMRGDLREIVTTMRIMRRDAPDPDKR